MFYFGISFDFKMLFDQNGDNCAIENIITWVTIEEYQL